MLHREPSIGVVYYLFDLLAFHELDSGADVLPAESGEMTVRPRRIGVVLAAGMVLALGGTVTYSCACYLRDFAGGEKVTGPAPSTATRAMDRTSRTARV